MTTITQAHMDALEHVTTQYGGNNDWAIPLRELPDVIRALQAELAGYESAQAIFSASDLKLLARKDEETSALQAENEGLRGQKVGVILSAAALHEVLDYINPDGRADADQLEAEASIMWREKFDSTDGDPMPAGYYAYDTAYPEEGLIGPLGEDISPAPPQAPAVPDVFPAALAQQILDDLKIRANCKPKSDGCLDLSSFLVNRLSDIATQEKGNE